jgi:hypothetical protein
MQQQTRNGGTCADNLVSDGATYLLRSGGDQSRRYFEYRIERNARPHS